MATILGSMNTAGRSNKIQVIDGKCDVTNSQLDRQIGQNRLVRDINIEMVY